MHSICFAVMPFDKPWSNEAIAPLVLAWAKEFHRDWYDKTLKVAGRPTAFRDYLLRLVERRCQENPAWMRTVPVMVLEETRVTFRVKDRETGAILVFHGKKHPEPRQHAIKELSLDKQEFRDLMAVKSAWDMEWAT